MALESLKVCLSLFLFFSRQTGKCFVAPKIFCHNKHTFVATKDVFCPDKHAFVATKIILVAAPSRQ